MELIITFSVLLIFVIWLQYEIRKAARLSKRGTEAFWKKEREANLTRRIDISGLPYIIIPFEDLPMSDYDDATINSYRDTILSLSGKKILNLSDMSNTDLKLAYGSANFSLLSEYDNNYMILVSILQKWGERLYHKGLYAEAAAVLEAAVKCHTDVKSTHILLAKLNKILNS